MWVCLLMVLLSMMLSRRPQFDIAEILQQEKFND
jgi:hypothetical protein